MKKNYKKTTKKFDKNSKKFTKKSTPLVATSKQIKDINSNLKKVELIAQISKIVQTGGPTIFVATDGTGILSLKGFISPGERAFPEINEGDCIKTIIEIGEFQGELEGNIKRIFKLNEKQSQDFELKLQQIELQRATGTIPNFLIQSPILDKLKDKFIKAAQEIRLAIIQGRPIIVRHHNDCDGYSSGFALERAILPLIVKEHKNTKSAWEFYTRAPSTAPFYEIDDSIRDTANSLRNVAKFSNKMPLIIIADNGSSPEDLMAIKQSKIHGSDFIVIDHHHFDQDVISNEVKVHINPFLVNEDGMGFSAGMLCVELARFINSEVANVEQIAAMAGFADRIEIKNPQAVNNYLTIAQELGYSKELLSDIALVIDYVSAKVRFMEVREYIEVLFGEPREKQKALVNLLAPYIRSLDAKGLAIAKDNVDIDKIKNTTLQKINIDEVFPGFGFFPKTGRVVGLLHDNLISEGKTNNIVTIGIMRTSITIRATDEANFSVHNLITFLQGNIPNAFVEGGGHKNAGSITFLPNRQEKILDLLEKFIKQSQ